MGRKSRYSEYAKGMKKKADAKNAATKSHNKVNVKSYAYP